MKQQSKQNLRTDPFSLEILEAARLYHLQRASRKDKGYVSVEEAAFIAGACWAKQVLLGSKKLQNTEKEKNEKN